DDIDDLERRAGGAHTVGEVHRFFALGHHLALDQRVATTHFEFRIDDEFLTFEAVEVEGVARNRHAAEGGGERVLIGFRHGGPRRADGEPRHGGNVEHGVDLRREFLVATFDAELV